MHDTELGGENYAYGEMSGIHLAIESEHHETLTEVCVYISTHGCLSRSGADGLVRGPIGLAAVPARNRPHESLDQLQALTLVRDRHRPEQPLDDHILTTIRQPQMRQALVAELRQVGHSCRSTAFLGPRAALVMRVFGRSLVFGVAAMALAGCQGAGNDNASGNTVRNDSEIRLFDPALAIQDEWMHLRFRGTTDYRLAVVAGRLAIAAQGRNSASGLIRAAEIDLRDCALLEWQWRVDRLQEAAMLRTKEGEDVAASIMLLFGNPGSFLDPSPVPTLRYVWTNGKEAAGAVIDSPYMPGVVKTVVVRAGTADLGTWVSEKRDMLADFKAAFGNPPPEPLWAVAIFTDNDQTKQPVEAYYGRASAHCR